MKILHVSHSDLYGGAAKAAYRLHRAQRKLGIDSNMLVLNKVSSDPNVRAVTGLQRKRADFNRSLSNKILSWQNSSNQSLHSLGVFSIGLVNEINRIMPDIVNLHWLGDTLSIKDVSQIKQPIVWTLHDMWAFSGTEHYDDLESPYRYKYEYSKYNRNNKDTGLDISKWIWHIKKKCWTEKPITIVTPSQWLAKCTYESELFRQKKTHVIQNTIDQSVYKPLDKKLSREALNLPQDKKIILFGAVSSISNIRKGYKYLASSLSRISNTGLASNLHLVIFGANDGSITNDIGIPTTYLGNFNDDLSLVLAYSSADLFIAPSLQDNLPNTVVESIACGTPCVVFDVGGMGDLITGSNTGILCKSISDEALSQSIYEALSTEYETQDIISSSIRLRGETSIAKQYRSLYELLIEH